MRSTSTIFDRTWRPGHPFRPRLSPLRRWGMFCLLCFLLSVIGAYLFLTDSQRVKSMAETYLTRLLGGRVQVKRATLSIFEGLRLDGVKVYVDDFKDAKEDAKGDARADAKADAKGTTRPAHPHADDALIFSATSFLVKYNPDSILSGALEATEIVAIDPDVVLCEDLDTGHWNFERMKPRAASGGAGGRGGKVPGLPQISLRNGQIAYRQFQAGRLVPGSGGSLSIDGSLAPALAGSDAYAFRLQSRGQSADLGPVVSGLFNLKSKALTAKLEHFEFGRDVLCMLPPPVRQWWVEHELSGWLDVPEFNFTPATGGRDGKETKPATFTVKTWLTDVTLAAWPEEWSEGVDAAYMRSMRTSFDLMRLAGLNDRAGGFTIFGTPEKAPPLAATPPTAIPPTGIPLTADTAETREPGEPRLASARTAGPNRSAAPVASSPLAASRAPSSPFVDCLESIFKPNVRFEKVSGEFVFTQDKIAINQLRGEVEGNRLNVNGWVGGYSPRAAADITLDGDNFTLPELPHYLGSMPKPIKDLLLHLRPHGKGNVSLNLHRPGDGGKPEIRGTIAITDGGVQFDGFPYPLRHTAGTITFSPDDEHPQDKDAMRCALIGVTGQGAAGGPNADKIISIDAQIAPLNSNNEVGIIIQGRDLRTEPALMAALPREAREALGMFDPTGTGGYPTFRGDVVCKISRAYGQYKPFETTLDLDVRDVSAAFKPFPYPIRGLRGKFHVEEDHIDILNATMSRPVGEGTGTVESTLSVDGTVKWGRGRPLMPTLTIAAKNLPVDQELLAALPAEKRAKLAKLGVGGGMIDVEGKVYRDPDALLASTLNPQAVPNPQAVLNSQAGAASEPSSAAMQQSAATQPSASVQPSVAAQPLAATQPSVAAQPSAEGICFDSTVTLRGVSLAPGDGAFAVRDVYGTVTTAGGKAVFSDFRGRRGDAELSGRGAVRLPRTKGEEPQISLWATARNLPLDEALYRLLPEDSQGCWDALAPAGVVDAELRYGPDEAPATADGADASWTCPPFELTIHPHQLSATVEAVPYRLDDVNGALVVRPGRVFLQHITAHHGGAKIALSGVGFLPPPPAPRPPPEPTREPSPAAAAGGATTQPASQAATLPATRPAGRTVWDLRLAAQDLPVDDDLRRALPPPVVQLMKTLKLSGTISLDFSKLIFFGGEPIEGAAAAKTATTATATAKATTPRAARPHPAKAPPPAVGEPDLDLAGTLSITRGSLEVGLPLSEVEGKAEFASHVRAGKLADVTGALDFATLRAADRPLRRFRADMNKPAGRDAMRLEKMQADVAGGEAGGQIEFSFPDTGASRFAVNLVLRNADVRDLTHDAESPAAGGTQPAAPAQPQIQGQLSASMALEGAWGDRSTYRGRGDVVVQGRELYKIPLMMGLLQITNLSLPITSPFHEATARYLVEGQRVTFEQIQLSAPAMRMQGGGWLDYAERKVHLTFTTDNPHWPKVPLLNELIEGAKHELLQIHVTGSIQDPKVSASMFSTLTTTVDEVTKGSSNTPGDTPPRKNKR